MRDYDLETKKRVDLISNIIKQAGAKGIVYGNSGGKDCTLVSILCKKACKNTIGLIMPMSSKQNYETDKTDAESIAKQFDIETRYIDLLNAKNTFVNAIENDNLKLSTSAIANIAPRLRMATLYAIAASENLLVAGTGNRSEIYMGYFTKFGDGAFDFNPIADLTVTEIYDFLKFLNVPDFIINKAPSGGLFDGQTDEKEMGISYRSIDDFLLNENVSEQDKIIIEKFHKASEHKRKHAFS